MEVVARALNSGNVALAQVATLLLKFPDPKNSHAPEARKYISEQFREIGWAFKDWDPELHPRTGVSPNPGWFAPINDAPHNSRAEATQSVTVNEDVNRKPYAENRTNLVTHNSIEEHDSNKKNPADSIIFSNISCETLHASDIEICNSLAFSEDHHYRKQCYLGASLRLHQCKNGMEISPLLLY